MLISIQFCFGYLRMYTVSLVTYGHYRALLVVIKNRLIIGDLYGDCRQIDGWKLYAPWALFKMASRSPVSSRDGRCINRCLLYTSDAADE